MLEPPAFSSIDDYRSRLDDVGFWSPHVAAILQRVGQTDAKQEPVPGYNATWPTFLCGEVVVKLFGYLEGWRRTFEAERGALALVSTDPEIAAPRILGEGHLHEAWPYVVT